MLPDDFATSDLVALAESTSGLSGSDLKEMCRDAAMVPVREYMKQHSGTPAELVKLKQSVGSIHLLR